MYVSFEIIVRFTEYFKQQKRFKKYLIKDVPKEGQSIKIM